MPPTTFPDGLAVNVQQGHVTSASQPLWRATIAAQQRIMGQDLAEVSKTGVRVIHLAGGQAVAVLRQHSAHKRWSVSIEGFTFWKHNRVLGYEHFSTVAGVDSLQEGRDLVGSVLREAGASKLPRHYGRTAKASA